MSDDLNKIPDVSYQLFTYLKKRLDLLEFKTQKDREYTEALKRLEDLYKEFLKVKN